MYQALQLKHPEAVHIPGERTVYRIMEELGLDVYKRQVPDLKLPEERRPIGHWGRLRQSYLKLHRPMLYNELILSLIHI